MPKYDAAAMSNLERHMNDPHHNSILVSSGKVACVDDRMLNYAALGQCCSKNPMKSEASLHNPFISGMYWQNKTGRKIWNPKCDG